MKKRNWLALLVCLLLPMSALAVTEGKVEDAPMVDAQLDGWEAETSYVLDPSYYAGGEPEPIWANSDAWYENEMGIDGYYRHTTQNPCLTAGEIKRAQRLLDDYLAGCVNYTGERVLEKMEGVIVGVYALDPADFDGEQAYVILPGTCLTDEQLLSIIAAYDEMGLVFDPEGLSYRNCSRGGGIETSRFMTDEESERYLYLRKCIRLGQLIPPEGMVNQLRNPTLNSKYFCGLNDFSLKPYRSLTDEEMVARLVSVGVHDERGEIDHAAVEAQARAALYQAFRCPLSMAAQTTYDGSYSPVFFTAEGKAGYDFSEAATRKSFSTSFDYITPEGIQVYAHAVFDQESGKAVGLSILHDKDFDIDQFPDNTDHITQAMVDEVTGQIEAEMGLADITWQVMRDMPITTNWGLCLPVRAVVGEGWLLTVYIGCDDGRAHGLDLTCGTLVDVLPVEAWEAGR